MLLWISRMASKLQLVVVLCLVFIHDGPSFTHAFPLSPTSVAMNKSFSRKLATQRLSSLTYDDSPNKPLKYFETKRPINVFKSWREFPLVGPFIMRAYMPPSIPKNPMETFLQNGFNTVGNGYAQAANCCVVGLKRWWWALPMILAFVPAFTMLTYNELPSMPQWWPLTKMDQLLQNPSYGLTVALFLSSNAFYFASGVYLLNRFKSKSTSMQGYQRLGALVLIAGAISTIFHSFQALGSFCIAEALCYIDHAVAVTSTLSFWHRCGRPGVVTTVIGLAGVIALVITDPLPLYPLLHSSWHGLSAVAAVLWAHDGMNRHESATGINEF